ncbi:SMP-30/gluconolactonase/LRE family protein [Devosia rhizoryzae]|uniref:SMP-30/gluconolactonase/LRE family protein n=1 Tax=Devosia rhizoryzae TaxID=2774137 RepID=A0ABX7C719_9HYPH|nr:SMP-30/gluconolactonase/LRE family protein [Devosia rhizoryzae]QQR40006.1 SMP-30/gluconolactonase/LRE family protein [Devosia rhizoryzae]
MSVLKIGVAAGAFALLTASAMAQQAAAPAAEAEAPKPFAAGEPLSATNEAGEVQTPSDNVRVFGSFNFTESCTFDPDRGLILAMNAGAPQDAIENDGFVSLINPDGTVHTAKWIGATRDGLTLNHPLGSAIGNGTLYAADMDTVRMFDLATGEPSGEVQIPEANLLNGIAATDDGTVYVTNTRDPQRLYKITPEGEASVLVEGGPLMAPNGVAIDGDGNVVVVNIGNNEVLTFSPEGELLNTENAVESGNDGLVILEDGTKYVSSVRFGSISRIAPGEEAEIIASGIPSAASICYDPTENQIIVPMNPNNALAFVSLD